jgi:glutathionyl-hydroquinone reductase
MYKFSTEVNKMKEVYEKAAMNAMTARLDYLYNYNKDGQVEEKKSEYIRLRDEYKRLQNEYESMIAVPNVWEKTGLTREMLKKATLRLPVDSNSSAFKVLYDMEERLWKANYIVPTNGSLPPINKILWIDE